MGCRVALEIQVECSTSSTEGSENQQGIGSIIEAPSIGSRIEQQLVQEPGQGEEGEHQSHPEYYRTTPRLPSPATRRTTASPPRRKTTFCLVLVRYVAASTLAVALTVACPGETDLWCHPHPPTADSGGAAQRSGATSYFELQWGILFPILLSLAVTQFLFISVVKSDPGYLDPEMMDQLDARHAIAATTNYETSVSPSDDNNEHELSTFLPASTSPRDGDEASNGWFTRPNEGSSTGQMSFPHRYPRRRPYCSTCRLAPPLRAHHCRDCQRCVATFDHHCPLIGNCVGERNRALFVAFLIAQVAGIVLCARVVLSSTVGLATIVLGGGSNAHTELQALQVFVTQLYVVPIAITAIAMATAHVVMVTCNISTFELAKGHRLEYMQLYDVTDCPFSSGSVDNLRRAVRMGWNNDPWLPHEWSLPTTSPSTVNADWWNHLWRNKYWSCC